MKVFWALVLFLEYNCGHVGTAKDELTIEDNDCQKTAAVAHTSCTEMVLKDSGKGKSFLIHSLEEVA
jgi:hypothetical protein